MTTPTPLEKAIIQVESGGDDYAIGDKTLQYSAYGPMQIRWPCVKDVNTRFGTNYRAKMCLGNRPLSIEIFRRYMEIYATPARLGRPVTDEDRARIWNGGPMGWVNNGSKLSQNTIAYFRKVEKHLKANV